LHSERVCSREASAISVKASVAPRLDSLVKMLVFVRRKNSERIFGIQYFGLFDDY
jgi:hypothetical protein